MIKNKLAAIAGTLLLIIGIVALFPLDVLMNDNVPGKVLFSFSGILAGILLLLHGIFNSGFLKSLAIIIACIFLSVLFWYLYYGGKWGEEIVMFWAGIPSGVISGTLFLVINKFFISKRTGNLIVAQVFALLSLLIIVNFLFHKGGDILYYFTGN